MSHLTRLFHTVTAMFCEHEWARRVEGRRVYLECMNCLSTTPGLDMSQTAARGPVPTRPRRFRTAEAA